MKYMGISFSENDIKIRVDQIVWEWPTSLSLLKVDLKR